MRFEVGRPRVCEATVVHEVQVGSTVQQQSMESALAGIVPESVRTYRSNNTCKTIGSPQITRI